uniref:DUF4408 domain-containing protein n=1 Tax=Nelumbo nucifera TaxID=4432 RepID=A0A822XHR4_NELNU|nr:TPA_asm: hypothetical protein HUJ06_020134 [Nelumbo nucifera]
MLDSTVEWITLAASNSLIVFCVCNLIVVLLLVSGSKPISHSDQKARIGASTLRLTNKRNVKLRDEETLLLSKDIEASLDATNDSKNEDPGVVGDKDDEEQDELRRRVEEFIYKVNKGWKAEMLGTSPYLQDFTLHREICKGRRR